MYIYMRHRLCLKEFFCLPLVKHVNHLDPLSSPTSWRLDSGKVWNYSTLYFSGRGTRLGELDAMGLTIGLEIAKRCSHLSGCW